MSEDQDKKDEQRRKLSQRRTKEAVQDLITNPDGLRRLRDISDEEWQAAVESDARNEGA